MKTIVKFLIATLLAVGSFGTIAQAQTAPSYKKVWWNPNQNGMGTFCDQQTSVTAAGQSTEVMFCSWFHYTPAKQPTFMIFSGALTKDSLGRDVLVAPLVRASGTAPVNFDQTQTLASAAGTMKLTFNSIASATFEYSFDGQSGILSWVPQIFAGDAMALKYTDKVFAVWTGGYPFAVTKTGVTKVVNKTSYTAGALPLFQCALGYPQLADGKVLTQCTNAVATASTPAGTRVVSYINPLTNEHFDYTGTVPSNVVWRAFENNADKPEWAAKARVSGGWYYTPFDAAWVLNFQPDVGTSFAVKAGTFLGDGTIKVMVSYTN